ncbi:LOW QUALITY PROTEIN: uncharacterized protein RHO17_004921 [Thomomys bottae]
MEVLPPPVPPPYLNLDPARRCPFSPRTLTWYFRFLTPPRSHARGLLVAADIHYVASYLLAALEGNSSPSAKDIKKILNSVGIAEDDCLNSSELNGKNIDGVIAQGVGKLASMPAGGAVVASAAPGSAAPAAGSAPAAAEEKKEEESDADMGFGLQILGRVSTEIQDTLGSTCSVCPEEQPLPASTSLALLSQQKISGSKVTSSSAEDIS